MFGTYRYILALMVMLTHLGPTHLLQVGFYAVFGFFMLSGYIMTMILDTHYFNIEHGRAKYLLNRLLRVMPAYWLSLILAMMVVWYFPERSSYVLSVMRWPESADDWITNLVAVGLASPLGAASQYAFLPQAWSLSAEIVFWLFIPALITSKVRFWLWGVIAVAYAVFVGSVQAPLMARYYSLFAAALPFFLGAWLRRFNQDKSSIHVCWGVLAVACSVAYYLLTPWLFYDPNHFLTHDYARFSSKPMVAGFYVALLINAVTIALLARVDAASLPRALQKIDTFLGSLSYPIFLVHIFVGVLVAAAMGWSCTETECYRSWPGFWLSFLPVHAVAVFVWWLVEKPLVALRRRVRNGQ